MSDRPEQVTGPDAVADPAAQEPAAPAAGASPHAAEGPVPADGGDPAGSDATPDRTEPDAATDLAEPDATPERAEPAAAPGTVDGTPHTLLAELEEDPRTREELLVAAHEAERQRDEYLDDLRRARAEFENFRRRTGREAATARETGRADVATALLDVLDDLDRTLEASDGSPDENLVKGVSLVADKLVATLRGLGLQRLEPTGEGFDPALHEAVQHVDADEATPTPVVERTLRPGYQLGDRVLRPAMVVVKG